MERPLDILIKDLPGEVRDKYMTWAEVDQQVRNLMAEGMPEPAKVSGLGRSWPGTHVSDEDTNRAQRLRSPRDYFTR